MIAVKKWWQVPQLSHRS